MKLTAEQIAQIRVFISKRGFTYPDVQLEIIDHVASRVEELMIKDPHLNLDTAIGVTHGEFGVMGFSVFEDAMISALQKKYFRLFSSTFLSYFNWRYTPLMGLFVYSLSEVFVRVSKPEWFFIGGFIWVIAVLIAFAIGNYRKYKQYNQLLTMKIGNMYLIIANLIFQLWNILGVQLRFYERLDIHLVGMLYSLLIVLIALLFITINAVREQAIASCVDLDKKYSLLNPSMT